MCVGTWPWLVPCGAGSHGVERGYQQLGFGRGYLLVLGSSLGLGSFRHDDGCGFRPHIRGGALYFLFVVIVGVLLVPAFFFVGLIRCCLFRGWLWFGSASVRRLIAPANGVVWAD